MDEQQKNPEDLNSELIQLRLRVSELEAALQDEQSRRKTCEFELIQKEQEYLEIIDSSTEGTFICDLIKNEIDYSYEWKRRLELEGLTPRETMTAATTRVHPEDAENIQNAWLEAVGEKAPKVRMEFRVKTVDAGYIWILVQTKIKYDEQGRPVRLIGTYIDITDIKKSEKLLENEERLQALMNFNPCLVFLKDMAGRYVYLNETYEKMFVGSKDWYGKTDFDFWSKDSAQLFQKNDYAVLESDHVYQYVEDSFDKEGNRYCFLCYKFPFTDSKNRKYLAGIGIDITRRVIAEEALQKTEAEKQLLSSRIQMERDRLCALINNMPDEVWFADNDQNFIITNESVIKEFGHHYNGTNAELFAATHDIFRPDLTPRPVEESPILRALNGEVIINLEEIVCTPKNHELRHRQVNASPVRDIHNNVIGAVAVVRDITEKKLAEQELRQARDFLEEKVAERTRELSMERQRLLDVLETLPINICLLTADFQIVFANLAFRIRYGEPEGRRCYEYICGLDERCPECEAIRVLENGQPHHWLFTAPDGSIIDVYDFPFTDVDGTELILEMNVDITQQIKMDAELARLDQLNLVGEMAASIGHEIRNPMTAVRGFLQLLSSKAAYFQDQIYFDLMIEELDRANTIISEYLGVARNKTVNLQSRNLDQVIRSLLPMIQSEANLREISIDVDLNDPPESPIDENEIRQLVLNISRNAMEAMPSRGTITIGTGQEGDEVILFIKDEGTGIPADIINNLGKPFLTTKEHGTGLGMAVCYGIAARHHATINFATGSFGTTFYVRFPLKAQSGTNKTEKIAWATLLDA